MANQGGNAPYKGWLTCPLIYVYLLEISTVEVFHSILMQYSITNASLRNLGVANYYRHIPLRELVDPRALALAQ
eukprot:SAG31_NODE_151_length_22216_cov_37.572139_6_plen_74_part_00